MASNPIISWQVDGENVESVSDFIFLGSKIIVNGNCCREIKRCLLFGKKAMTNLMWTISLLLKTLTLGKIESKGKGG